MSSFNMSFLEQILASLEASANQTLHIERSAGGDIPVTGSDLLRLIAQARKFLAGKHLRRGDRCALLAPNSIRWVAMDLAIMAEGLIVVPLYSRQAAPELVAMMKDCSPSLIVGRDATLRGAIVQN